MRILVSGASVAGPVLAHWLTRYGFSVTVVERAPAPRRTGGHAVDLFRPAMDISEKMGVLPHIEERATGTSIDGLSGGFTASGPGGSLQDLRRLDHRDLARR
ncbi:FAD-dependent monooxygenase [Streptomyces murinus]